MVLQRGFNADCSMLPGHKTRHSDQHTLRCNAYLGVGNQPDIAVDATARVPARRLLRIVQADGDNVVPLVQRRCQICFERSVSVWPAPDFRPIAIHDGTGHRPVNTERPFFSQVLCTKREMLPIPGLAPPGQFSGLSRILLAERAFHAPVMGQGKDTPDPIVIFRNCIRFGRKPFGLRIQFQKSPVIIESKAGNRLGAQR